MEAAAEAMECSDSRLSLIENGKQGVRPKTIREMAALYGLRDRARVTALEDLARKASEKGWWAGFENVLPARFESYVDLETDARELLAFSALTLHGLLQTKDYALAISQVWFPDASVEYIDRIVELRMARQQRLTDAMPLTAWFVLDEATLRRPVGGAEVMREQLRHLLELSESPQITVQTLPFAKGVHAGLDGAFVVLRFPDPSTDHDVVYVEGPAGNIYLEAVEHSRAVTSRFDRLRVLAQDEADSRRFLKAALKEI
jgi:hypothetical protein